jgi:phage terminase large subunit
MNDVAPDEQLSFKMSRKQSEAYTLLCDIETIELLFGGGAGGGKSKLGCFWGIMVSLHYPGARGLIGRDTLKGLKESTLLTFFDICADLGLIEGDDYTYNQQDSVITFENGSTIYLKELGWLPSDPNYDRLGSTEYTWAFIDEAQQVRPKAKNIVRTRIRYKLREFGLIAKLLMSCNPSKGWLYAEFYRPNKDGTLPKAKKFLVALATDNPFLDPAYLDNLRGLDVETQERLLYGNWEYDDDPAALMRYEAINDLFTNIVPVPRDAAGAVKASDKAIICDVARFGNDRTTVSYWEGLVCKRIAVYTKLATVPDPNRPGDRTVAGVLNEWRETYTVPLSRVLVDEDGVGGGVVDYLHCKGFMGGRKPFPMPHDRNIKQNYSNLRSQCCYKLAEMVNLRKMAVPIDNADIRDMIVQELEQIKAKHHDEDTKPLQIVAKDEIKDKIGRSPDIGDNLMMRMWFEFAPVPRVYAMDAIPVPVVDMSKPATRKLSAFEMGL